MVDKIIPPRRDEILSSKGVGERRFLNYLEENARQTNKSTSLTEADPATVNMSSAQLSAINKRIDSIVNENLTSNNAVISKLLKRIEDLESTIINNQNSKADKKVTALENDFIAPFYKTKYDELTVKKIKHPLDNDASSPTIQFGDGDTGFYEESDDILSVSVAGVKRFTYRTTDFRSEEIDGAAIRFITPTSTTPSIVPNINDPDTGIGWATANELTIIESGVEIARFAFSGINIPLGRSFIINGASVLSSDTLGSGVVNSSLTSVGTLTSVNTSGAYSVSGTQVVGAQGAAVADASGGATIDAEARTAINALLAEVRAHGLIA